MALSKRSYRVLENTRNPALETVFEAGPRATSTRRWSDCVSRGGSCAACLAHRLLSCNASSPARVRSSTTAEMKLHSLVQRLFHADSYLRARVSVAFSCTKRLEYGDGAIFPPLRAPRKGVEFELSSCPLAIQRCYNSLFIGKVVRSRCFEVLHNGVVD